MKIYIYYIFFPTSKRSNPYYIGIAKNLERRMFQHLNSKYQVGKALLKYDDWIIKKLHTVKTYEEAFRLEIEEIRNFNCVAPNGYNMTAGGDGCNYWEGKHLSKEHKIKIRKSSQGIKKPETSKAMIGNQHAKGHQNQNNIKRNRIMNKSILHKYKVLKTKLKNRIKKLEQENNA